MQRCWLLALLAFALALGLRVVGLGFFLPHQSDPDGHAVDQLRRMRTDASAAGLSWGKYGHLVARTLWLLPEPRTDLPLDPAHADEHLRVAGADHLRARWISALLGALIAPATFWLARRWLAPGWSLLAAALVATSLLHVSFSQQARPHVPFATLALFAVLAALRVRREPSARHAGLYALALFFAVGTLHSAAFLLPAGLAALLLREKDRPRPSRAWIALPLFAVGASLLAFWPFLYRAGPGPGDSDAAVTVRFPHLVEAGMFDGGGFAVLYAALRDHDPLLLATAVLGAACALLRLVRWRNLEPGARRDLGVVLAFALPYALVFGAFGRSFERFFLPLYPYLAVLAALGLRELSALAGRVLPVLRRGSGPVLAVGVLALPGYAAGRLAWLRAQPDTYEQAAAFLDAQAPGRLLLDPRAVLPVLGRLAPDAEARFPSAWLRYLAAETRAERPITGWELVPFPSALEKHVRRRSRPGDADALLAGLRALGCTHALDILPERGSERGTTSDALYRCADLVWQVPGALDGVYAENGYQPADLLHVALRARSLGPRLALWEFRR